MAAAVGLTILLAAGFATAGEAVLRRRSASVAAWTEAFLVGAGCSAALLFPLSLVLRSRALGALMLLLGLAVVRSAVLRLRNPQPARPSGPGWTRGDLLLAGLIGLAVASFVALSLRYAYGWDGFLIYATKAKVLFYEGALTRNWFADGQNRRLLIYPPLVPMFEAMLGRLRGTFDFDTLKPIFPVFYIAMLVSTFTAIQSRASRRLALWTVLLVAILPELATIQSPGGSSDMPQAAFIAGTVAACFRRESRPAAPFLIGSLTVVKPEGTILALIASAVVLGFWSRGGLRRLLRRLRIHAAGIGVVAVFLLLRLGFLRWLGVDDRTYAHINAQSLSRSLDRVGLVASTAARLALDPAVWGVLWPLFLIAGLALARLGTRAERCLVGAVVAAVAAYTAIFLFTNWNVELHLRQAYTRLLAQIAPAAAIAIALSYDRVHRRLTLAAMGMRVGP